MPAPRWPLEALAASLRQATTIKRIPNVRLLVGKKNLPLQGAPPRFVLVPTSGPLKTARKVPVALVDCDLVVVAHVWGSDGSDAWDLSQRLLEALEEQAAASDGSFWYEPINLAFATDPEDTEAQGEEIEISIRVPMGLKPTAADVGRVPGEWSTGEITAVQIEEET